MVRAVDNLPTPSTVRPMKVIGLGPSRTGTLGLTQALKILGYHPFHISELIPFGIQEMKALQEAMIASHKGSSQNPFGNEEFEKMWGAYDCIIESPCYLGTSAVESYLKDTRVKFILTERTPQSWSKSISGSLGAYYTKLNRLPLSFGKYFDSFIWELNELYRHMVFRWAGDLLPTDPKFKDSLEKSYIEYMATIKALVPDDRLLVLNLEKGFDWEEICTFLDRPIPETPYPRTNSMKEFHEAAEMIVGPAVRKGTSILFSAAVAAVSVGVWYWRRRL